MPDWDEIKRIFAAALEREPAARPAYLDQVCGERSELRSEIEALIAADARDDVAAAGTVFGAASLARPEDLVGTSIEGYLILEVIETGGMGIVYLANQSAPVKRQVAMKVIRPGMTTPETLTRFEYERDVLARLDHPNVASVYDAGVTRDGRPWLVMEYVPGTPITTACDAELLPVPARLRLFIDVCAAIHHAHQNGIIHRDLKPSNVLVYQRDGVLVPKVIDFGVAKALEPTKATRYLTEHSRTVGTIEYMSPEQFRGPSSAVDTRTDVYALGMLLYQLLAGDLPVDVTGLRAAPRIALERAFVEDDPPRPSQRVASHGEAAVMIAARRDTDARGLVRALRGDLDWIVMKAIRKDRERRYASASEMAADIERHLVGQPVTAGPPGARYRMGKFVRRNRTLTIAFVLFVVFAAGFSGYSYRQFRRAEMQATRAMATLEFLQSILMPSDPRYISTRDVRCVQKTLDYASARLATESRAATELTAALHQTLSDSYGTLGLFEQSAAELRSAIAILDSLPGDHELAVADARHRLGDAWLALGATEESRRALDAALAAYRRRLAGHDPRIAHCLALIAVLSHVSGGDVAEGAFHEAAAALETTADREGADAAAAAHYLGEIHWSRGDLAAAETLLREALRIRRTLLGDDHPLTAASLHRLAGILMQAGQFDEAEAALLEVVRIRRSVLIRDHPYLADSLHLLGELYRRRGAYTRAETALAEALAIRERVDPDAPPVAVTLESLAAVKWETGRDREAIADLRQALRVRESAFGDDNLIVAATRTTLAEHLAETAPAEAEALARAAVRARRERMPPGHRSLAHPLRVLGAIRLRDGDAVDARTALEEARAIEIATGEDEAETTVLLAAAFAAEHRYGEAERLLDGVGPDVPLDLAIMRLGTLATVYDATGRSAEAEAARRARAALE